MLVIANCNWGSQGAGSPPVGPGQSPGGIQGAKPPEALKRLQCTVPKKDQNIIIMEVIL